MKKRNIGAVASVSFVAWVIARFFGRISPKIRIKSVIKPVAIPIPELPNIFVAITVTIAVAAILARFVPISMMMISRSVWSRSLSTWAARDEVLASVWNLRRLIDKNALSHPEKNAEKKRNTTRRTIEVRSTKRFGAKYIARSKKEKNPESWLRYIIIGSFRRPAQSIPVMFIPVRIFSRSQTFSGYVE